MALEITGFRFQPTGLTSTVARTVGFDFGRFVAQTRSLLERLNYNKEEAETAILVHMDELFDRIRGRTPVDRSPSADDIVARLSWEKEITRERDKVIYKIWNTARRVSARSEYAYPIALEFGYSGQAPHGMVRISLAEFRAKMSAGLMLARRGSASSTQAQFWGQL